MNKLRNLTRFGAKNCTLLTAGFNSFNVGLWGTGHFSQNQRFSKKQSNPISRLQVGKMLKQS